MDTYLPAEYLKLRDELEDWRDATRAEPRNEHATDSDDDPDPSWQVL
ncbi:MAG: hypothetical protein JSR27_12425 [Proteobacteria bacterium]|nr:hypothetical protein [Pseudomonadota bacterium]